VKILHRLLVKAFLGPFVLTFLIVLFVLVMQFLWVYIDDLVGKGLEWYIIAEVLFYASASFVPLALPLAILLASIMTFGNLGEFYELTAIKSSGISLWRFMRPLTVLIVLFSIGAFYFSNTVLPVSRLKFGSLLYDIQQKKPALSIKEGIFYTDIDNYAIRIESKSEDNRFIRNVLIYDHTSGRGNVQVVTAEKGEMYQSSDERYLTLKLYNGYSYEEMPVKQAENGRKPQMRTKFREQLVHFDLSALKMQRTDEELFKDYYSMLNVSQLGHAIDSLETDFKFRSKELNSFMSNYYQFKKDTTFWQQQGIAGRDKTTGGLLARLEPQMQQSVLQDAINNTQALQGFSGMKMRELGAKRNMLNRHYLELHRKFALSFACLVLFLIGAPLGAIIRRGGLGLPMLFCILFFLIYHVITMTSEKLARDSHLDPSIALWISSFVLLPIGLFLIYKANSDSRLFDAAPYRNFFNRFFRLSAKTAAV